MKRDLLIDFLVPVSRGKVERVSVKIRREGRREFGRFLGVG